jgi:threonine dehydrogenase-like Zn-dependent dehydrogenase
MTEPLANAVSAVRQAEPGLGDRVVIVGPGPIGLLALQVARLSHPAALVLVGTRDERLRLGEQLGASHTVNARREGALETLHEILEGKGADAIIECAGTPSALQLAMNIVAWRGRIVIEGVHDQDEVFGISPYMMLSRSCRLVGVAGWVTADFARALELMAHGLVDVRPLITHNLPLDEWETGFRLVTERKDEAIKVLLVP